ncbi:tetratricopeptide repeat protein [Cytophagaceae bacterium DM2B3-1]|uniref:Tetratricopeptide repeat protein n=1 Tax=Xanthocytophaga flava TaxID=3048013 RepID=A0ABT7CEQ9_9BACT|nr:tetratricopeptide repeat protein [Xanthocytophaga flavus]MDJ1492229.1 tetratricopeptide repeat protein [Xanthocytophaga flavus]
MIRTLVFFLGIAVAAPWIIYFFTGRPVGVSSDEQLLGQGNAFYQQGEYGEAEVSFRKVLASNPEISEAKFYLGLSLYQQQRYTEALLYVNKSSQLATKFKPQALHIQGNILLKMNRWAEAASCYRNVLLLRPGYLPAQKNLSYVLQKIAEKSQKKDPIRNINQVQKQLDQPKNKSEEENENNSSDDSQNQDASQSESSSKNNIQSSQQQLNASDMESMLKQLDQAEKQIRGRNSKARAEKTVLSDQKDW